MAYLAIELVVQGKGRRGCSSVGNVTDVGSTPRCAKGFFSQSQLSVQTPLWCSHNPRVQSYALTSVSTLTIPCFGSHAIVWTHANTARTVRNWWRCSCGCCSLNSFIPVLNLALLPLISVFLCIRNPFVPGFSEEKLCKRGCVRLSYLCV